MQDVIADLQKADAGEVRVNEPMGPYTTWHIGGPADALVKPKTREQLAHAVGVLRRTETPWFVLGRGSNLLVSDKGIRGVVIKPEGEFDQVRFDGNIVTAGGAFSFISLSVMAGRRGLSGLEFAGGIPGSVGGAVYMNAGAHGSDVSRVLKQAEVLLDTGELATLQKDDLQYAYRHSVLHRLPGIVTEAVFSLECGDKHEIDASRAAYRERRLSTQPLQLASAGSVFRNPENRFAAQLIEEAGLKGMRVGGAEVSTLHANFIINTGQATAQDVHTLISRVQDAVHAKAGVRLVPEVLFVGER